MIIEKSRRDNLDAMNFLNNSGSVYPGTISFASGRPHPRFFGSDMYESAIRSYVSTIASTTESALDVATRVAQYGPTEGIIGEHIARQMATDFGIACAGEDIIVTCGCQEAIALSLLSILKHDGDVLLVRNPAYTGITGAAATLGLKVLGFNLTDGMGFTECVTEAIKSARSRGLRPRALYVVPDFDNPSGTVLPLRERHCLLELCRKYQIAILEDTAYALFRYEGTDVPSLTKLDDASDTVVWLGTYSKSLCPAVRVGYLLAPKRFLGRQNGGATLKKTITAAKSYLTVNTSQINQAIVAGALTECAWSMRSLVDPARNLYRSNRDRVIAALQTSFESLSGVQWNSPEGGFFLRLKLPFPFREYELNECADKCGVVVTPMSFFSLDDSQDETVRISFSAVAPDDIAPGINALAQYATRRARQR